MKLSQEQQEMIAKAAVILAKNKKDCSGFTATDGDSPRMKQAIKDYLKERKVKLNAFDNVMEGTYEQCQSLFNKAVGPLEKRQWKTYGGWDIDEWVRFSMFDTVEYGSEEKGTDWTVKYPDFEGNPLVCEGDLKIKIEDWDGAETTLTNPRINDVFRFFANNHDGHHGYIEGVSMEGDTLVICSGS